MKLSDETLYNQYLRKHKRKQNRGHNSQDSERQKTYEAEFAMLRKVGNVEYNSIEQVQKVAKSIYKSKTWGKLWSESINDDVTAIFRSMPPVESKLRSTGRGTSGWTNGRSVTLDTKVGLNKYTLLHELTHCLGHMHHGRSFRQTLLKMVGAFMGAKEKKLLKAEFKKRKLACGEPRKPMTFEKWNEARIRMQTLRGKNV